MADRVALMTNGKLATYGTPDELYQRPANCFVAEFIGNLPMNFLDVEVTRAEGVAVAQAAAYRCRSRPNLADRLSLNGDGGPWCSASARSTWRSDCRSTGTRAARCTWWSRWGASRSSTSALASGRSR